MRIAPITHYLSRLTLLDSDQFGAVFSFDKDTLDPILMSNHFIATILEFSVFGQETVWKALERSAKPDVLFHTAVYAGFEGKMFKMCLAPLRRRPNGADILCCNEAAIYVKGAKTGRLQFRCAQGSHSGARTFRIRLLPEEEDRRWILCSGRLRVIIEALSDIPSQDEHAQ